MSYVVLFLLGCIVGALSYRIIFKQKTLGTIRVARIPDEPPYLFLEINTSVEDITSRDVVSLKVSQK